MKMTEKLFNSLRVVFGSHRSKRNDPQILCWAKTEYGNDWRFAYDYMTEHNKTPIKGIDY
jgi:hypothetical protein